MKLSLSDTMRGMTRLATASLMALLAWAMLHVSAAESPDDGVPSAPREDGWRRVDVDGVSYILWEDFCRFYHLSSSAQADAALRGTRQNVGHGAFWLSLGKDTQSIYIQGHLIELTHPLIYQEPHRWLISEADCFALLDAILRADYLMKGQPAIHTIVIDAPHGGSDRGILIDEKRSEATYTLQLAERLKERLDKHGYYCVLTRTGDEHLSDQARVDKVNSYTNALYISLRLNQGVHTKRGVECYTTRAGLAPAARGKEQRLVQESALLGMMLQSHILYTTHAQDAGLRGSYYSYLRSIKHPACAVYLGYMSHEKERALLLDKDYQQKILDGLERAIVRFVKLTEGGS